MGKLGDALRRLTVTLVLLFFVAAGLFMNWVQLRGINKNLDQLADSAGTLQDRISSIEGDLSAIHDDLVVVQFGFCTG
jgi:ABC-type microcin C transport system permease subunit YejB